MGKRHVNKRRAEVTCVTSVKTPSKSMLSTLCSHFFPVMTVGKHTEKSSSVELSPDKHCPPCPNQCWAHRVRKTHLRCKDLRFITCCCCGCMPSRGAQPAACGPHAAQDGSEWGPTRNRKFTQNSLRFVFVIARCHVLNVWPKTTLLLPLWPRDAKRSDTPALGHSCEMPRE